MEDTEKGGENRSFALPADLPHPLSPAGTKFGHDNRDKHRQAHMDPKSRSARVRREKKIAGPRRLRANEVRKIVRRENPIA